MLTDAGDCVVIMPSAQDLQLIVEWPNQKWLADFTYIWTVEGWLYVTAVIELFSCRIIGWSMNANIAARAVTEALIIAIIWR